MYSSLLDWSGQNPSECQWVAPPTGAPSPRRGSPVSAYSAAQTSGGAEGREHQPELSLRCPSENSPARLSMRATGRRRLESLRKWHVPAKSSTRTKPLFGTDDSSMAIALSPCRRALFRTHAGCERRRPLVLGLTSTCYVLTVMNSVAVGRVRVKLPDGAKQAVYTCAKRDRNAP